MWERSSGRVRREGQTVDASITPVGAGNWVLSLVQKSGRQVSRKAPWSRALRFPFLCLLWGFTLETFVVYDKRYLKLSMLQESVYHFDCHSSQSTARQRAQRSSRCCPVSEYPPVGIPDIEAAQVRFLGFA